MKSVSAVWPARSPDSSRILYSAASSADAGEGTPAQRVLAKRRIWMGDASRASAPRQITGDAGYRDESPVSSCDSKIIFFCRIDSADQRSLWKMNADGTELAKMAEFPFGRDAWFGYYGHIAWRRLWDWRR